MDKRATTITKMTIRYIAVVVGLVLATTLLWAALANVNWGSSEGYIVRADKVEKEFEAWINSQSEGVEPNFETFPREAEFYYVDKDFNCIASQINDKDQVDFLNKVLKMKDSNISKDIEFQEAFLRLNNGENTLFVHYSLALPNEWKILLIILALYFVDFVVPTAYFIHEIKKNVTIVKDYAVALGKQDLAVSSVKTKIRELNEVTETMEMMRRELQTTMESQWAEEQTKKETMAQIAHDLKTPLTIIRGNAELLSEQVTSDEDREALETIIQNCERIAQSIVEILII